MSALLQALLLGGLMGAWAGEASLAPVMAEMKGRGLGVFKTVSEKIGGVPVSAVIFRDKNGNDRLDVYASLGRSRKAYLIHTHAAAGEQIDFDETLGKSRFPDLLKDGARTLLYRAFSPALNQRTLYVLRYSKPRFKRIGVFPDGRLKDMDGDGRYEIVTRELPLGRFFLVGCEETFQTMAQGAYQTDIQAWRGGRFVSVASRFPEFYAQSIAREEEALRMMDAEKTNRPGDYLALALTLYYDYAARGEKQRGWERFLELCRPPRHAPSAVRECLEKIKEDLRARLSIPEDWP